MADRFESLMLLLGDDVSIRWLITLLHFLWQGAVIGGVAAVAGRLMRGASAQLRYAGYSAALLSLPVCVAVTFCLVDVPASPQPPAPPEIVVQQPVMPPAPAPQPASQPAPMVVATPMETVEMPDAPVPSEPVVQDAAPTNTVAVAHDAPESVSHASPAILSRAAPWITAAYAIGVICFLLRLFAALWGGRRLQARTTPVTDVKLLKLIAEQADRVKLKCVPVVAYCERVAVPTVLGVLRPVILLPVPLMTGLAPDDFAAIIRHELAHIRRYDLWMNLLQRVIESLLFFHPVVWFISRRVNAEREGCCDDLVVSSGCEPMHYAGALLRMAELCATAQRPGGLALAATGDKKPLLERRIERLMNWGNAPRLQLTRAGMAGLLTVLVLLAVVPGVAHTLARAQASGADSAQAQSQPADDDKTQDDADALEKTPDKETVLRKIREATARRADAMRAGRAHLKETSQRWPSPDPRYPRGHGAGELTGTVYFDSGRLRFDGKSRHTRDDKETTERPFKHLYTAKWAAMLEGSGDIVGIYEPPNLPVSAYRFDPREMGEVFVGNVENLRVDATVYEDVECLRLEEVLPRAGLRSVQIIDPRRGYVALRKEKYFENSVRSVKVQETLTIATTIEYQFDDANGIWLPSKVVNQTYDAVPLGEDRQPTLIQEDTTQVTDYSFQPPPPETFTLAKFCSEAGRLRDNRKKEGGGKWYTLPSRNLADPNSKPNTKDLPPDLVNSVLGIPEEESSGAGRDAPGSGGVTALTKRGSAESPRKAPPDDDVITIRGNVVDPDGKPAGGAAVHVLRWYWDPTVPKVPLAATTADSDGRFEITYRKSQFNVDVQRPEMWKEVTILATAKGLGPDWIEPRRLPPGEELTLHLVRDDVPVIGRVIDVKGKPVPGVTITMDSIAKSPDENLDDWLAALRRGELLWQAANRYLGGYSPPIPREIMRPVQTKPDGSFEIRGVGRERWIRVTLEGPTISHTRAGIVTRKSPLLAANDGAPDPEWSSKAPVYGADCQIEVQPTRPIVGTVRDAETGAPLPGVAVESYRMTEHGISAERQIRVKSDERGCFRLVGMPKGPGKRIIVVPGDDQPYLMREFDVPDQPGSEPIEMDLKLHRGVWITGRVTDKSSGKPVRARVHYLPYRTNPFAEALPEFDKHGNVDGYQKRYATNDKGDYRAVGLPGRAILGVESVDRTYPSGVGHEEIAGLDEDGRFPTYHNPVYPGRKWPTAMKEIVVAEDAIEMRCDFALDAGRAIQITAVDPQGRKLGGLDVVGKGGRGYWQSVESATFDAVAFAPGEERTLLLYQPKKRLGKVLQVTAADGAPRELTVQLDPCVTIRGRLVDGHGKPITGASIRVRPLPGGDFSPELKPTATDADGRFEHKGVLPGTTYNVILESVQAGLKMLARET